MTFISLTFLTLIYIIFLGLRRRSLLNKPKKYFYNISIQAIFISLVIGLLEGTWCSHGFDVPWWAFSLISFVIFIIFTCIFIETVKIINRFKKRK